MMDSYDCIVVGNDLAARVAALSLAQVGLRTLLLRPASGQPDRTCGDVLLPICGAALERLGLVDPLAESRVPHSESLQLLGPEGKLLLGLGGGPSAGSHASWRLPAAAARALFDEAARRSGVQIRSLAGPAEPSREEGGGWRVTASLVGGGQEHYAAPLVIAAERPAAAGRGRVAVWGYYRSLQPGDSNAVVAIRPLDGLGWCWLVPLADGLTSVGAVVDGSCGSEGSRSPAEILEDRLVQCPLLLQRMLSAELDGELFLSQPAVALDPWCAFVATGELLAGRQLADRALEAFQTGDPACLAAPLQRAAEGGLGALLSTAIDSLFDPQIERPGFFASRAESLQALNASLASGPPASSPFPPAGGKAILTRV